jgi:uncharacterized RDD family membrane protein YckC
MNNKDLLDENLTEYSTEFVFADFGDRFGAMFVDGLIFIIPSFIFNTIMTENMAELVNFVLNWLYYTVLTSSEWQATIGKKSMNLVVTDMEGERISFGKANVRYFSSILSALILLIGYFMQPFTEKKQALHDMIANTLVLKRIV